eukprot:CAMPEP_0173376568 /NCGR_PEP_ID=MMETSP1144-20121109/30239_1 /TAXON_ID=483371 /ORGANISM="non described non described, Strain CCMP2298" /LENGTH=148 /DNA_ID=CAMNT_0014329095 /DNA_START=194 /DNA_END=640 /DNA_ORIENTATION=-
MRMSSLRQPPLGAAPLPLLPPWKIQPIGIPRLIIRQRGRGEGLRGLGREEAHLPRAVDVEVAAEVRNVLRVDEDHAALRGGCLEQRRAVHQAGAVVSVQALGEPRPHRDGVLLRPLEVLEHLLRGVHLLPLLGGVRGAHSRSAQFETV